MCFIKVLTPLWDTYNCYLRLLLRFFLKFFSSASADNQPFTPDQKIRAVLGKHKFSELTKYREPCFIAILNESNSEKQIVSHLQLDDNLFSEFLLCQNLSSEEVHSSSTYSMTKLSLFISDSLIYTNLMQISWKMISSTTDLSY